MNPLHLIARNYRCFGDLDLVLPDGCVAIIGENGAGKSSIVNAIDLTIFGARSLADLLTDTSDGDELLLELELEHAGEFYRIRRTYSPRGRGKATLDFESKVWRHPGGTSDDFWTPLTRGSARETQELIEQTIGLSRETFRASAFLAQGDGAAFTDAQPRDRKRILSQVLGLDRYDHLQERARQDRRTFEADLQTLDGKTTAARELVEQKPAIVVQRDAVVEAETELADRIADLEREHAALAERFQEAREHGARRQAAEARLAAARQELEQLQRADVAATDAVTGIAAARAEVETLATDASVSELVGRETMLVALADSFRAALAEHEKLVRKAQEARAWQAEHLTKIEALVQRSAAARSLAAEALDHVGESRCELCSQILGAEAAAAYAENQRRQAAAWGTEITDLQEQVAAIVIPDVPLAPSPPQLEGDTAANHLARTRRAIELSRAELSQRARLDERIRQLQPLVDARPSQESIAAATEAALAIGAELAELAPVDVGEITRQGTAVRERLDASRATLGQQRDLRARLDERLAQITAAEETVALFKSEAEKLKSGLDCASTLEKAFGRDGIPALIVENSAIPYLETEATQVLSLLGGKTAAARVELRTQAELKSGDGLRDTLDIVVVTEHDSERSYENWSGGEQMRINLALRVALAKLLAHGGAASGIFVIDEPDGLDATGKAALIDILRDMQGRGIERVYLISHDADLRDSFDTTLSVVDGRVDSGLAAVPA